MANLTHFFKRSELKCKCGCGKDTVDYELLLVLDLIRMHFDAPVIINSGNRCFFYNSKIGGSSKSQHLLSKAADIVVKGVKPNDVYNYLNAIYPEYYGLGNYKTFTHIDVRSTKARF